MRRTCGEGFGLTSGYWKPQNSGNDFAVRAKYQHERARNKQQGHYIDWQVVHRSVSTCKIQNGGNVTEKVIYLVRMTEVQRENLAGLSYLHGDSTDPGTNSQLDAYLVVHD